MLNYSHTVSDELYFDTVQNMSDALLSLSSGNSIKPGQWLKWQQFDRISRIASLPPPSSQAEACQCPWDGSRPDWPPPQEWLCWAETGCGEAFVSLAAVRSPSVLTAGPQGETPPCLPALPHSPLSHRPSAWQKLQKSISRQSNCNNTLTDPQGGRFTFTSDDFCGNWIDERVWTDL